MEENQEDFLHFVTCLRRLHSALVTLRAIREAGDSPLVGSAFRFALVEYATPYNRSVGKNNRHHHLETSYIPSESMALHRRLIYARNKIHAHTDLTLMEAKLYVNQAPPFPSVSISGRHVDELAELCNIDAIVHLIEGTIANMNNQLDIYVHELSGRGGG